MFAAAQTMARNSRLLPSRGDGADSVACPARVKTVTPATESSSPAVTRALMGSLRIIQAATATRSGTEAEMIPAWAEVVSPRADDSNQKYRQGWNTTAGRSSFQSPRRYADRLTVRYRGRMQTRAMTMRSHITLQGCRSSRAMRMVEKEAPQSSTAPNTARRGSRATVPAALTARDSDFMNVPLVLGHNDSQVVSV